MILLRLLVLLPLIVCAPCPLHAGERPHENAFRKRMPAGRVADELRAAAAAGNRDEVRRLAARAWPDPFEVTARMLFPPVPGTRASDADRAALARFAAHASDATGVAGFIEHWLGAKPADFAAEREFWRVSARMTMRLRAGNPSSALEAAAGVRASLAELGHSHQGPFVWELIARALSALGRAEEAVTELEALVRHVVARRWPAFEGRAREALVIASRAAGRSDAALIEACDAAAGPLQAARDWRGLATILGLKAASESRLARHEAAEETAYRALIVATEASLPGDALEARLLLAQVAAERRRDARAAELRRQVFDEASRSPHLDAGALAASGLAFTHMQEGQVAAAMRYGDWLEDNQSRLQRDDVKGDAALALGDLALWRGRSADALSHYRRALAAHRTSTPARLLSCLARMLRVPGRRAPTVIAQYRETAARAALSRDTVSVLADWSRQELRLGNPDEALRLARRAAEHAARTPEVRTAWTGPLQLARVHVEAGRFDEADTVLAPLVAALPARAAARAAAFELVARCDVAQGRHAHAVASYRSAVDAKRGERRGVADREALYGRAAEHALAMAGLAAAARWHAAARGGEAALEAAWWFREVACGRLLTGAIAASGPAAGDAATLRAGMRAALAAVEGRHRALVVAVIAGDVAGSAAARAALQPAYERLARAEARIHRRSQPTGSTEPASLAEVRASLPQDAALIAYAMSDRAVYGLAVTNRRTLLANLGERAALEKHVRAWRRLAATPGGPEGKLAARLHDALLAPFAGEIRSRERWIVLPDGVLNGVPVDAWLRATKQGSERVLERHAVTYAQAHAVRDALRARAARRPAARGLLAMGDPTPPAAGGASTTRGLPLQRLPASGDEARAVAALYPEGERRVLLGDEATRARWLSALAGRDAPLECIHLACHGLIDDDLPSLSGLLFAGGEVLTAERLQAMRFDTDLAVLSACRSGGETLSAGEGVLGLTRALFEAGVTRLVATTWQVADRSTADLMVRFHEGRRRRGLSEHAALRAARLALLRAPQTAHPYYWAGFQLWGP